MVIFLNETFLTSWIIKFISTALIIIVIRNKAVDIVCVSVLRIESVDHCHSFACKWHLRQVQSFSILNELSFVNLIHDAIFVCLSNYESVQWFHIDRLQTLQLIIHFHFNEILQIEILNGKSVYN